MSFALPAPDPALRCCVVVPARDEAARIEACLHALADQRGVAPAAYEVLLVLDACSDDTAQRADEAGAAHPRLRLLTVPGPGCGVGAARRAGMELAHQRLESVGAHDGVLASTDADSVVAPDWLANQLAAVAGGAQAVGGRILLHPVEAAALGPQVLDARAREAAIRLTLVREHADDAEHHQFSGASLALTPGAYRRVGGLAPLIALEDEALEHALRSARIPIAYRNDVRVTTSARTEGRVPRGLAQVLRTTRWATRPPTEPPPDDDDGWWGRVVLVAIDGEDAARAVRGALTGAGPEQDLVVALPGTPERADVAALASVLAADRRLVLAKASSTEPHPLDELVARPLLNANAPDLAAVRSPLAPGWAVRRSLLDGLSLPAGVALNLTVLVDAWRAHGLAAIAEVALEVDPARSTIAPGAEAYRLMAAMSRRFAGHQPLHSGAYTTPDATLRVDLGER